MKTSELVEFGKSVVDISTQLDNNRLLSRVFKTKNFIDPDRAEAQLKAFEVLKKLLGNVAVEVQYVEEHRAYDILIPKASIGKLTPGNFSGIADDVYRAPQGGIHLTIL